MRKKGKKTLKLQKERRISIYLAYSLRPIFCHEEKTEKISANDTAIPGDSNIPAKYWTLVSV